MSRDRPLLFPLFDFVAICVLSTISTFVLWLSLTYKDPISGDFSSYISIATNLIFNPRTFDPAGTWPLGYPLALRAMSLMGDWNRAGALISYASLLTISISSYYALKTSFRAFPCLLGSCIAAFNSTLVTYSVGHSSEMPTLAFAYLCLACMASWLQQKNQ